MALGPFFRLIGGLNYEWILDSGDHGGVGPTNHLVASLHFIGNVFKPTVILFGAKKGLKMLLQLSVFI